MAFSAQQTFLSTLLQNNSASSMDIVADNAAGASFSCVKKSKRPSRSRWQAEEGSQPRRSDTLHQPRRSESNENDILRRWEEASGVHGPEKSQLPPEIPQRGIPNYPTWAIAA
ncbi:expressed unknown protein [Seminavis robusta]|uniref:Uncharacterized protein n=1 Tax=Seminavis robusta TaxID=568900 RepID=A0A9N8EXI6_9STRA|nr:expressed unknown protein [Seminavis robusta]|eukprot:Sro1848_g301470.1 n/a (113) ;mRNA; f:14486-14824